MKINTIIMIIQYDYSRRKNEFAILFIIAETRKEKQAKSIFFLHL